jgi:NAD(P)H-nitrite reductase large subunit
MSTHHVIVGGGPAATNAVETIREIDGGSSKVTLISDELAHSRMALPYWLAGDVPREHTHTGDAAYFKKLGVTTHFGVRVTSVDSAGKTLALSDDSSTDFDQLLIATGSSPISPPIGGIDLPGVQPLWSLAHTQQLLDTADGMEKPRVVLVGAGFIGFIVLNAMFKRDWNLTVVEREGQVLPRMLDGASAGFVSRWLESRGVGVHTGTTVQEIRESDQGSKLVQLASGQQIEADLVIIATGIQANIGFLDGSGLETDQGVLVNDQMQTNFANIYAAGDVAQGPVLFNDAKDVHAIQTTAVDHGRVAGANMAGQEVHYPGSLLMNVVDVCGLQTASFGNWDDPGAEATTISNENGLIYRKMLWRDDQLVGAILTGRADDMGMLTDVGMIKGILQTQTPLGAWKGYLQQNPFDLRRAYIAIGVAQKLVSSTLLGRPTRHRGYRFRDAAIPAPVGKSHGQFVATKPNE